MSISYPIIVKSGVIYFSARADLHNGLSTRAIATDGLYRPYGFVVPDGGNGLGFLVNVENPGMVTRVNPFVNRAFVIDHKGTVTDITIARLEDKEEQIDVSSIIPTGSMVASCGDNQRLMECSVLMRLSDNPMEIFHHVAKINNDTTDHFRAMRIDDIASELTAKGFTRSIDDYIAINRARAAAIDFQVRKHKSIQETVNAILGD